MIDPLTVIDAYGADALRFALSVNASQGRDLKIGEKTAESYRNFATKLWNASRFAEMNGAERVRASTRPRQRSPSIAGSRARQRRPPPR